jgi:translation initiation factor IF-2
MKHLLTSAAVMAALAFAAPAGAQAPGGNSMGMPGPSPGGPGLTPYSTGPARPVAAPAPAAPAPAATMAPPMSDTTSAMPPKHRHARTGSHGKMASHHPSRFPNLQGNSVANELNQAELARLQSGNFTPPTPPPGPDMGSPSAPPSSSNRMPAGGRTTSDRYGR